MHRTRPRAAWLGLAAAAMVLAACSSGHTSKATPADRECSAVTQAANGIRLIDGASATNSDVTRSSTAVSALTSASAAATTAVAGPAGQLAAAARSYVSALQVHNLEGINVAGGVLRQRAQAVADVCSMTVLGLAPAPPTPPAN
jgi:hypothetical protein